MLTLSNKVLLLAVKRGFRVTKAGIVISPRLQRVGTLNAGYWRFSIKIEDKTYSVPIHRLQAYQKFGDKIFDEGIVVRHKDSDSMNNSWNNILIGTNYDNAQDKGHKLNLEIAKEAAKAQQRFTLEEVKDMRLKQKRGIRLQDIGAEYGIGKGHVSDIVNRLYR